jgi:hypothetical protein
MDEDHKGEDGDKEGEEDWNNIVDGEAKTISSQQANTGDSGQSSSAHILTGKQIAITGIFPHLEEGNGLNVGKAQVAAMIQQHGGIIQGAVQGNTNLLIVGEEPGRKQVEEAIAQDTKMVALATVEQLFEGTISWEEFMQASSPIITKHSSGFQGGAIGQEEVSSKSYAQALAGSMKGTEQASSPTGAEGTNSTTPATGTSHPQGNRLADPPQGDGSPEDTVDPPSTDKPKANQMEGNPSSTDNLAANQGGDLPSGRRVLFHMPKLQRRLQLPSRGNNSDLGTLPSETGLGFV